MPKSEEPIELRTVHPAPPASTKVHGKTYVLQTSQNPYRVNPEGKYDQEFTNANIVEQGMGRLLKPNANPWDDKNQGYLKYVREGGEIFFQNCHFCHGDNLNGRGLHAAFNPIPANFRSGTTAQLQEPLYSGVAGWYWIAQRRISMGFSYASLGTTFDG